MRKAYPATLTGKLLKTQYRNTRISHPYPNKLRYLFHALIWPLFNWDFNELVWSPQKMGAVLVKEGYLKPVMKRDEKTKKMVVDHWDMKKDLTSEALEKVLDLYDYETLEKRSTVQDEAFKGQ